MRKNHNYKFSRGFTLVEVLIAFVILGIGLMAIAKFQSTMIRSNTVAKQRTEATVLAENTIEKFRSQVSDINPATNIRSGSNMVQRDSALFTRSWVSNEINRASGIPTGDVELKITVSWPDLNKTTSNGVAVVSEDTTVYLASIISNQPFSDSAMRLKASKSPPIELTGSPSPRPGGGMMGGNNSNGGGGNGMMSGNNANGGGGNGMMGGNNSNGGGSNGMMGGNNANSGGYSSGSSSSNSSSGGYGGGSSNNNSSSGGYSSGSSNSNSSSGGYSSGSSNSNSSSGGYSSGSSNSNSSSGGYSNNAGRGRS